MTNHTEYRMLASGVTATTVETLRQPEQVVELPKLIVSELTFSERYEAKKQARKHMDKGNIANARDAIRFLQGCENPEQAKLFVKSLKPNY